MSKQEIKGYRTLTKKEIELINEAKEVAVEVGKLCDKVASFSTTDRRWSSIGTTDLQKGFMSLIRSIAQPETF